MCGLFGHIGSTEYDLDRSRGALQTLAHRGPDQWGEWFNQKVYIGHRRLSILDLSEQGRQPMADPDGNVTIAVNGEIYNYLELKNELSRKYRFKSQSDSEVLLYGYQEWGIGGILEKIDGMYAFCIFDRLRQKLFLARDRAGIKPLYYAVIGKTIAWASELKAIEAFFSDRPLEIDRTALYDFLTYLYVPTPKTLYRNVYKLEPAHYIEIDADSNRVQKHRYWSLTVSERPIPLEAAGEELRRLVKKSVREQMMSDVPVGFFLSGGIDSSAVTAEASALSSRIRTYSIGFDHERHDETAFAERVALHFHAEHEKRILDRTSAKALFDRLKEWYDEPFGDTSAFPTYLVSKFAKEKSTVALTGDGGDELFGGYNWYARFKRNKERRRRYSRHLRWIPSMMKNGSMRPLRRLSEKIALHFLDDLELYTELMGGMLKDEKKEYALLWEIPGDYDDYWHFRRYYREELPLLTRLQYLDFHTYLPDDILTKVDRVSMAVALEARVPLLSRELIEFSFSLQEETRYLGGQLKGLMKRAYTGVLPDEIIRREKKGFSIPLKSWAGDSWTGDLRTQEYIIDRWFHQTMDRKS